MPAATYAIALFEAQQITAANRQTAGAWTLFGPACCAATRRTASSSST